MEDHKKIQTIQKYCPVCDYPLKSQGPTISTDELFRLWIPMHQFSNLTISEHFAQSDHTTLYRCSRCRLEIFLPQIIGTPSFYEELQDDPATAYYVDDKWDFDAALQDVNKSSAIIEIGCGPGNFLEKVTPFVSQSVGIEYNQHALQIARQKGLNVYGMDDDLTKLKGQFDTAFAFHVLEHVPNPLSFLQELLGWVKPDGNIVLSVPNQGGPIKYSNPCIMNMPPHHATRWRLKTFHAVAKKLCIFIKRVAFEPLNARDIYYYSLYGVEYHLPSRYPIQRKRIGNLVEHALNQIFNRLRKRNKKFFSLLKGQSLYVVLSRQK